MIKYFKNLPTTYFYEVSFKKCVSHVTTMRRLKDICGKFFKVDLVGIQWQNVWLKLELQRARLGASAKIYKLTKNSYAKKEAWAHYVSCA